jgi:2-polyprenyl-3-methyl-5-hydroxy-6-metoxy-1,4-benzoquinol methylase
MTITASGCLACGATATENVGPTHGGLYSRCLSCGLQARITDSSLTHSFEAAQRDYYGDSTAFEPPFLRRIHYKLAAMRLKLIRRHLTSARILEVGPGGGELLLRARHCGFQVEAVEHSEQVAGYLRQKLSMPVAVGSFETADLPLASYDAVFSMHVIEHVPDPLAHLRRARDLVRPGGYLFLGTPNLSAWSRCLAGCRWSNYSSAHIFLFTPRSMMACLENTGWRQEACYSIESAYSWPRTVINMLRNPRRVRPASQAGALVRSSHYFTMAVAARTFGAISWPLRVIQAKLGGGDEFLVVARRVE